MKYLLTLFIILTNIFLNGSVIADISCDANYVDYFALKTAGNAKRKGAVLSIYTAKGLITFKDNLVSGEGYTKYAFIGSMRGSNGYYSIVSVNGYESGGYELLNNKTGKTIFLYRPPKLSPNRQKFIDYSFDLEAGYYPNIIRVYKFVDNGYVMEWEYRYSDKGPEAAEWINDSEIFFFETTFKGDPMTINRIRKPVIIKWNNKTWTKPRPLK